MAGVASDNAELARQLDDVREQQRAISGVLRAVARSDGLQPVLDEVVEACRRLSKADQGALYLLQDGLLHSAAHHGLAEAIEYDRRHPHALDRTTAAGRAAVTRQPVHIPDIEKDPEYTYAGPRPYRSMLTVPVIVEDELIGALTVVREEQQPFTEEHIALVQTFADQAAIAIANARLIEAVERQRTELSRFVAPQVAELVSSSGRRAAPRRPPRLRLVPVLRPTRLHGLRGDRRAGGAVRRVARVPRRDRRADPGARGDAGALRGRRGDGVLQRPGRRRRTTSSRRSGSRWPRRSGWPSSPRDGESGERSWRSG